MSYGYGQQDVNRSAQEHLLYIQEKVNPILEALVTAVLLERPEDPSYFMLRWLCEQTKSLDGSEQDKRAISTAEEIETVRAQIKKMQERKAELLALRGPESQAQEAKTDEPAKADEDEEEEEEEDEDDGEDPEPLPPPKMNRGPRASVSAEAYGLWNKKTDFVAPVYEKTPEQKARIERTLEPSFLFSGLDKKDLNTVVLAFKEKIVEANQQLIRQGDDGESMFVIEEGTVDCLKTINGEEKVVKTCHPGDVFGELALLYNVPRAATVVSKERAVMWELDRGSFNRIVKDAAANKRNTFMDFLKKVPLFDCMEDYELMSIADALKVEEVVGDGTAIIRQGERGDKFYVLHEGSCIAKKVYVEGQEPQVVMTYEAPGSYFGELALLNNDLRAASVYVTGPSAKLLVLDRKTFKRLLGNLEDLLLRQAARYESSS